MRVETSALAPFRVTSFRFQWPADLASSWAFEMETIILGWYVLVETRSVELLTLYGALLYLGTLLSPLFGVLGHRIGNGRLLCMMRALYTALSATLMILAITGALNPPLVFVLVTLAGLVRPSDMVLRYALIAETIPAGQLVAATGISRTTMDSARIVGALAGAGLASTLGIVGSYAVITAFYVCSFALTLGVRGARLPMRARTEGDAAPVRPQAATSPWRDLRDVAAHVRATPPLLAAMAIALLVNFAAFPLPLGLLPYVAKEVYHTDQAGLGYLAASFAFGALAGSLVLTWFGHVLRPARMMLGYSAAWYAANLVFAYVPQLGGAIAVIALSGLAQSLSLVPMSALLLRNAEARFRGGVMGVRMLMIYGLPVGLMVSGPLIGAWGYQATITTYSLLGLAGTALIVWRWGEHIWRRDATGNVR